MRTAAAALEHDRTIRWSLPWPRAAVWAWLISYPFTPWLLAASWRHGMATTLSAIAWSVAGPIAAWFLIRQAGESRSARSAIVLEAIAAAVTPPFFAIFTVVLALSGWSAFRAYIWFGVLALLALAGRRAPAAAVRQNATIRRVHYASAVPLVVFLFAHVANHLMAVDGFDAHVRMQNALRLVYRNSFVEPLLVVAVVVQVLTGAVLVWNARGFHFTRARALQFVSGAYLSMFFFSHMNAVFVIGRGLQHADTTFQWAAGGQPGLLASAGTAVLLPYYLLSVLAFFMHVACASRRAVAPLAGERVAVRAAWAVGVAGLLVTLVLVAPLTGFRLH